MVGVGWEAVIPLDENRSWHSDTDSSHLLLSDMRELIKVQNVCASADMRQHTQRHALATEPQVREQLSAAAPPRDRRQHTSAHIPFSGRRQSAPAVGIPWCLFHVMSVESSGRSF